MVCEQATQERRQTGGEEITPTPDPLAGLRRELRQRVRVDAIIPATYQLNTPGGASGQTVTRNLSLGGTQIFLPERLPVGTSMTLTLRLPRGSTVSPRGRVAWQGKRFHHVAQGGRVVSTGIQFESLTSRLEEQLSAFVDRLLWKDRTAALSAILKRLGRLAARGRTT